MTNKNPHAKSCIRVYNTEEQKVSNKESFVLSLEGIAETDCGCSMTLNDKYVQINNPGLYHISADFNVTYCSDSPVIQHIQNQS